MNLQREPSRNLFEKGLRLFEEISSLEGAASFRRISSYKDSILHRRIYRVLATTFQPPFFLRPINPR